MVLEDLRENVREFVEVIGLSQDSVLPILNDNFCMGELPTRRVHCDNFESVFGHVQVQFGRVFSIFRTWILRNTPEIKQHSKQCKSLDQLSPRKAKVGFSGIKRLTRFF